MRPPMTVHRIAVLVLILALFGATVAAIRLDDDRRPILDAHLHYSQDAWDAYPIESALALLDRAGVRRAFVSSTPDEGTLRLVAAAPDRFVPVLRPYRTRADMTGWPRDPDVAAYVLDRIDRQPYRGIGEFHLLPGEATQPTMRALAEAAIERGLFLHVHADAPAVAELIAAYPAATILWAHAGMSARPATVERLIEASPTLSVELALRTDVAPGGRLDPAWSALFHRYPDRFLVGSDTWVPSRWGQVPAIWSDTRVWLDQLPPDLADRLAYRNAEALATPAG